CPSASPDLLCTRHGPPPPGEAFRDEQGSVDAGPGVCPPLPHEDPSRGGAEEVGRGPPPGRNMEGRQATRQGGLRGSTPQDDDHDERAGPARARPARPLGLRRPPTAAPPPAR